MQDTPNISATDFLDSSYLGYARYTVENRAIPSFVDGLKPSQRKIIHTADHIWKNSTKPFKIFQLAGQVASYAAYHHGDQSLNSAIIGMAQSFKNSAPLLSEIGQFGSLRSPEAGAPRYISTRLTDNFRLLYKDFELLQERFEEGEKIEPEFFLPIIPTILLNGTSGIAVGFATNILNRNPIDLVNECMRVLDGKRARQLSPWRKDFNGTTVFNKDDDRWEFYGIHEIVNTTTVHVTELPPSITWAKYEAHLNNLQEKGIISDYDNNCSNGIDYLIKFSRKGLKDLIDKDRLISTLKLRETQSENIVCIDHERKILQYDKTAKLIDDFVVFRSKFYDKRKKLIIDNICNRLLISNNKARFIRLLLDKDLVIDNISYSIVVDMLTELKFDKANDSYEYLLTLPMKSLTKEHYEKLCKEVEELEKELKRVKAITPTEMYMTDLQDLKKSFQKTIKNV